MSQSAIDNRWRTIALAHIPIAGTLLILLYFALLDTPILNQFRTEETFGWMVVLWIPLAILLGLVQLFIWLRWAARHSSDTHRKTIKVVFLLVLVAFLTALVVRLLA